MAFRRKTYRKKSTRRVAKRKSYSKKRTSPMKRMVKREIARTVETKHRNTYVQDRLLYPTNSAANFDTYNVIPMGFTAGGLDVVQGTGQGSRVGNRIKVKRIVWKGTMVAQPYDVTTNPVPFPMQVRIVFLTDRDINGYPTPATGANIFDLNNGVYPFQNDLVDQWAPFNNDRYQIWGQKRFKLGYQSSLLNGSGTSGTLNYANNDFKLNTNFSIDITKWTVKNQIFQDNSSEGKCRQVYAAIIISAATGGAIPSSGIPAKLSYSLECDYEDA